MNMDPIEETLKSLTARGFYPSDAKNVLLESVASHVEAYKYRGRNRTRTLYTVVYVHTIHNDGTVSGFRRSNILTPGFRTFSRMDAAKV